MAKKTINVVKQKKQKRPKKSKKAKKARKARRGQKGKGQFGNFFPTNRQIDSNQYWQLRAEIAGAEARVRTSLRDRQDDEKKADKKVAKLETEVKEFTKLTPAQQRQHWNPGTPDEPKTKKKTKQRSRSKPEFEVSGIYSLPGSDEFSGGERQSQARRRPKSAWSESEGSGVVTIRKRQTRRTPEETSSFTRAEHESSVRARANEAASLSQEGSLNVSQGLGKTYKADWGKGEVTQSQSFVFAPEQSSSSEAEHSASSGITAYVQSPPPPTPRSPVAETPPDLPPRSHHRNTSHSPTGAGGKAALTRTTGVASDEVLARTRQKAREKQSARKQLTQRTGSQVFVGETPKTDSDVAID